MISSPPIPLDLEILEEENKFFNAVRKKNNSAEVKNLLLVIPHDSPNWSTYYNNATKENKRLLKFALILRTKIGIDSGIQSLGYCFINKFSPKGVFPKFYDTLPHYHKVAKVFINYWAYRYLQAIKNYAPDESRLLNGKELSFRALLEFKSDALVAEHISGEEEIHAKVKEALAANILKLMNNSKAIEQILNNASATLCEDYWTDILLHNGGRTKLHNAVINDDSKYVKICISSKTVDINAKDDGGNTALHLAIMHNTLGNFKALLNAKPQLNILNNDGLAPLHIADITMVKLLLTAGANPFIKSGQGLYTFEISNNTSIKKEVAKSMLQNAKNKADFQIALLQGAQLNDYDFSKGSLLLKAINLNDYEFFTAVIESGVDVNYSDSCNMVPIRKAIKNADSRFAIKLIEVGANFEDVDFDDCKDENKALISNVAMHACKKANQLYSIFKRNCKFCVIDSFKNGNTMLHKFAMKGDYWMVEELILRGANPFIFNIDGKLAIDLVSDKIIQRTLFEIMIKSSKSESDFKIVLKMAQSLPAVSYYSKNLVFHATIKNNIGLVKILLELKFDPNIIDTIHDEAPLHAAIRLKHHDIINLLLNYKPTNINLQTNKKLNTTLHMAMSYYFDYLFIRSLLKSGADPKILNAKELNPFGKFGIFGGEDMLIKLLLKSENYADVKIALMAGANINSCDNRLDRNNILQLSILNRNFKLTKSILNMKESLSLRINHTNYYRETALHIATKLNRAGTVKLLLKHPKINPYKQNREGATALSVAKENKFPEIIEAIEEWLKSHPNFILNRKASKLLSKFESSNHFINEKDYNGNTSLHLAIIDFNGLPLYVKGLLALKADPNIQNNDGDTPLHLAVKMGYIESASMLFNSQPISSKNKQGYTPLTQALSTNDTAMVVVFENDIGYQREINKNKFINKRNAFMKYLKDPSKFSAFCLGTKFSIFMMCEYYNISSSDYYNFPLAKLAFEFACISGYYMCDSPSAKQAIQLSSSFISVALPNLSNNEFEMSASIFNFLASINAICKTKNLWPKNLFGDNPFKHH